MHFYAFFESLKLKQKIVGLRVLSSHFGFSNIPSSHFLKNLRLQPKQNSNCIPVDVRNCLFIQLPFWCSAWFELLIKNKLASDGFFPQIFVRQLQVCLSFPTWLGACVNAVFPRLGTTGNPYKNWLARNIGNEGSWIPIITMERLPSLNPDTRATSQINNSEVFWWCCCLTMASPSQFYNSGLTVLTITRVPIDQWSKLMMVYTDRSEQMTNGYKLLHTQLEDCFTL